VRNPYQTLGVAIDASDETIRKAWLQKVRQFPPETAPEQFKEIREAFETINTSTNRLRHFLMSTDCYINSPFEALTVELQDIAKRQSPSISTLGELISQSYNQLYS